MRYWDKNDHTEHTAASVALPREFRDVGLEHNFPWLSIHTDRTEADLQ